MQKCAPVPPNPTCGFGSRRMLNECGVLEDLFVEVGRAVGHHQPLALLDLHAAKFDVLVAVRWNADTGVAQRMISSAVVDGRSFLKSSHWSGLFASAIMPWVIELRVVSLPATASMIDEEAELVVGELLAVDVGLDQRRDDVVGRVLAPLVGHGHRVHDQFHRRLRRIDVGELGILAAGHLVGPAEQLVAVLLRNAEQTRRWPAAAARTTPVRRSRRCPRRQRPWRCSGRAGRAPPRARPMARGVKPREMILRSRVWCGASMLSMTLRCSSTESRVISCGQVGIAPFCQLEKTSLRRDTSLTSACLVTSQ